MWYLGKCASCLDSYNLIPPSQAASAAKLAAERALSASVQMAREIPESNWKRFRELRQVALERFCQRTLGEVVTLSNLAEKSFHERYLSVYRRIEKRDQELARAFNDARRSRMLDQLAQMRALGLLEDQELAGFSEHTREVVALLSDGPRSSRQGGR